MFRFNQGYESSDSSEEESERPVLYSLPQPEHLSFLGLRYINAIDPIPDSPTQPRLPGFSQASTSNANVSLPFGRRSSDTSTGHNVAIATDLSSSNRQTSLTTTPASSQIEDQVLLDQPCCSKEVYPSLDLIFQDSPSCSNQTSFIDRYETVESSSIDIIPTSTTPGTSLKNQASNQGVKMPIGGVTLEFPFEPYPLQKHIMNQVLLGVKTSVHCLVDSPTGTGKTLALLCSTLAWQQKERELQEELQALAPENEISQMNTTPRPTTRRAVKKIPTRPFPLGVIFKRFEAMTDSDSTSDLDSDSDDDIFQESKRRKLTFYRGENVRSLDQPLWSNNQYEAETDTDEDTDEAVNQNKYRVPRIFYGTRTHKQIEQVIKQLKKTAYANNVKMTVLGARDRTCVNNTARNQQNLNEVCQALLDPQQGAGCSYYNGVKKIGSHEAMKAYNLPAVFDIEDVVKMGTKKKICPYFTLRKLVPQSEIIFCPYNYLIDPTIRKAMNISIAKDILIIDEAHNIEEICKEVGGLLLKQSQLELAVKECRENIKKRIHSLEYKNIRNFLKKLHMWIDKNAQFSIYSAFNESLGAITGENLIALFHQLGITKEEIQIFKDSLARINQERQDYPEGKYAMSGIVKQVGVSIVSTFEYLYNPEHVHKYRAYFCRQGSNRSKGVHPKKGSNQYMLHIICLSPAVIFNELLSARSIILASGTLSPLESFQSELAVKFPKIIKTRHIVPKENVFISPVGHGPMGEELKGYYEFASSYDYQDELGRTILETLKIVPHGVLCFFQSYSMMDRLKERWILSGFLRQLERVKETFWEPSLKQEMDGIMERYSERIRLSTEHEDEEKGGVMFAVFRGKVAEGIDFSDNNARAVIAVGLPFLNKNIMQVRLKVKYNEDKKKEKNQLSGTRWYKIQAFRALNQALGRCIRHKNDWGAILLIDSRFTFKETQDNLPIWVQQEMQKFTSWNQYVQDLKEFIFQMKLTD